MSITEEEFRYCEEQVFHISNRYRKLRREIDPPTSLDVPHVIGESQIIIELSAKVLFRLVGKEPPEDDHAIDFQNGQQVIREAEYPSSFSRQNEVPRLIFLTQFWSHFYVLAKYGDELSNVAPQDLFAKDEAKLAVEHAKFAHDLIQTLLACQHRPWEDN